MTPISNIMTSRVTTIRREDTLSLALQTMLWSGCRHLPVVHDGKLVGILSERDVLQHSSRAGAMSDPVGDAMSAPPHVASPEDPVEEVALRMAEQRLGCMPIVQRGDLLGIVTTTDLLAHEGRRAFGPDRSERTAEDIMTRDPMTVRADDTLQIAVERMAAHNYRHLPVLDGDDHLVGMLEDRAIRPVGGADWANIRVASVMDPDPYTVEPDAPLGMLINLFADSRLSAVAVADAAGNLVGIVSYVDVLEHLRKTDALG